MAFGNNSSMANILIVDDLELSIFQFNQLLKKIGITPVVARNKDDLISNIVEGTKSQLIDVRGNVAVIYKKQSN